MVQLSHMFRSLPLLAADLVKPTQGLNRNRLDLQAEEQPPQELFRSPTSDENDKNITLSAPNWAKSLLKRALKFRDVPSSKKTIKKAESLRTGEVIPNAKDIFKVSLRNGDIYLGMEYVREDENEIYFSDGGSVVIIPKKRILKMEVVPDTTGKIITIRDTHLNILMGKVILDTEGHLFIFIKGQYIKLDKKDLDYNTLEMSEVNDLPDIFKTNELCMRTGQICPQQDDKVVVELISGEGYSHLTFMGYQENSAGDGVAQFENSIKAIVDIALDDIKKIQVVPKIVGKNIKIKNARGTKTYSGKVVKNKKYLELVTEEGIKKALNKSRLDFDTVEIFNPQKEKSKTRLEKNQYGLVIKPGYDSYKDLYNNEHTHDKYDIKQNSTGDCYLLSGINSLKYNEKYPDLIREAITMVKKDGQWVYQVIFKKYPDHPQYITKKELSKTGKIIDGKFKGHVKFDKAAKIFEIAYGRLRKITENKKRGNPEHTMMAVEGGFGHHFIEDLTKWRKNVVTAGAPQFNLHNTRMFSVVTTFANAEKRNLQALKQALIALAKEPNKFVLTVNTPPVKSGFDSNGRYYMDKKLEFISKHAYSIAGVFYDEHSDRVTSIFVINPHNSSKIYEMTPDEFNSLFSQITINEVS
ncbi:hypothetical protein BVY03_04540 [bacterium K02(2017)]|nr:hypothetical protein BVY03_04540 [bacterium K02(2017)]